MPGTGKKEGSKEGRKEGRKLDSTRDR